MRLVFKRVVIESFLSIGNADITLQDGGYTLIKGINNNPMDNASSNGSGKSSIFEAIVWCLTGTTMRGSKDVVNDKTNTGALVELELLVDGREYRICRSKEHERYKTNLRIFCDGTDVSGKGIRDSEKILEEHLPDLTAELLGSVIVLGQGLPCKFTRNSPSGRKDVLEKLSKSDFMIEDLKERVTSRKTLLNTQLREIQDSQLRCRTRVSTLEEESERIRVQLEQLRHTDAQKNTLDGLREEYQQLNETLVEEEAQYNIQCDQCHSVMQELSDIRSAKDKQLADIQMRMKDELSSLRVTAASLCATRNALRARIQEVESIRDICPTCGQHLQGVVKPSTDRERQELRSTEEELSEIQNKISGIEEHYETLLGACESEFRGTEHEIQQRYSACSRTANAAQQTIAHIKQQITLLTKELNALEVKLATHDAQVQNLETRLQECSAESAEFVKELEELSAQCVQLEQHLAVVTKFETLLKRDFRGALLNNVINYIQEVTNIYAKDIFDAATIQFELEGNNIVIRYDGRDYENLSGGERQKVDLVVQFSIRDMLCKFLDFESSILVLDEIFDNLDALGSKKVNDMLARRLCGIDSIYIISHHAEELNIPVDRTIVVCKDVSGVSTIQ